MDMYACLQTDQFTSLFFCHITSHTFAEVTLNLKITKGICTLVESFYQFLENLHKNNKQFDYAVLIYLKRLFPNIHWQSREVNQVRWELPAHTFFQPYRSVLFSLLFAFNNFCNVEIGTIERSVPALISLWV